VYLERGKRTVMEQSSETSCRINRAISYKLMMPLTSKFTLYLILRSCNLRWNFKKL